MDIWVFQKAFTENFFFNWQWNFAQSRLFLHFLRYFWKWSLSECGFFISIQSSTTQMSSMWDVNLFDFLQFNSKFNKIMGHFLFCFLCDPKKKCMEGHKLAWPLHDSWFKAFREAFLSLFFVHLTFLLSDYECIIQVGVYFDNKYIVVSAWLER